MNLYEEEEEEEEVSFENAIKIFKENLETEGLSITSAVMKSLT